LGDPKLTRLSEIKSLLIRRLETSDVVTSCIVQCFTRRTAMLRKTLVTLTMVAVLGAGSVAMARGMGGGGWGGGGWGGSTGMHGIGGATMHGVGMGHPMAAVRGMGFNPNHFAWGHEHFHDRFHHRFRNRFFAFGFGGPYLYDYAYNSCWTQIPTRYGSHWVYVCGDAAY
jgi:hypothetical protein